MIIKPIVAFITHDFYKDEKYILSTQEGSIALPHWEINNYKNLDQNIKKYVNDNFFTDNTMANGYVNPKFIGINDKSISELFVDTDINLYFLYGCICPKLNLSPGFFWKTFDIFDTDIRTELGIINEVISKTI
jgi:hypothetical protein